MSDATAAAPNEPKSEVIEDAVVVETASTPESPAAAQVVYVQAPTPPRKKGNRGGGAAIAVASGIIFAAALAALSALVGFFASGTFSFTFLAQATFYSPVLLFIIAFVLLVLVVNRASWWAYIFGSILVAVVVYFGTIALGLLSTGIILNTPEEASARYAAQLTNPFVVIATLLAREVSLWMGALIARRGRKLKASNSVARDTWEREVAEKKAEHERPTGTAATAV